MWGKRPVQSGQIQLHLISFGRGPSNTSNNGRTVITENQITRTVFGKSALSMILKSGIMIVEGEILSEVEMRCSKPR